MRWNLKVFWRSISLTAKSMEKNLMFLGICVFSFENCLFSWSVHLQIRRLHERDVVLNCCISLYSRYKIPKAQLSRIFSRSGVCLVILVIVSSTKQKVSRCFHLLIIGITPNASTNPFQKNYCQHLCLKEKQINVEMMMLMEISHTEEDKYYIFSKKKRGDLIFNPIIGPETIKESLDLDWEREREKEKEGRS